MRHIRMQYRDRQTKSGDSVSSRVDRTPSGQRHGAYDRRARVRKVARQLARRLLHVVEVPRSPMRRSSRLFIESENARDVVMAGHVERQPDPGVHLRGGGSGSIMTATTTCGVSRRRRRSRAVDDQAVPQEHPRLLRVAVKGNTFATAFLDHSVQHLLVRVHAIAQL